MQEDKIIQKLIEHDEKLNNITDKMMLKEDSRKIMETLEDIATRVKRIDEDRVFSYQWIKRIEDRMEIHEKDLQKIKAQLLIS